MFENANEIRNMKRWMSDAGRRYRENPMDSKEKTGVRPGNSRWRKILPSVLSSSLTVILTRSTLRAFFSGHARA